MTHQTHPISDQFRRPNKTPQPRRPLPKHAFCSYLPSLKAAPFRKTRQQCQPPAYAASTASAPKASRVILEKTCIRKPNLRILSSFLAEMEKELFFRKMLTHKVESSSLSAFGGSVRAKIVKIRAFYEMFSRPGQKPPSQRAAREFSGQSQSPPPPPLELP